MSARRSAMRWALIALGAALGVLAMLRFPWIGTVTALLRANPQILWAALAINLTSLIAKGWAWHLLLRRVAPNRWRVAQEANVVGAAVNNLSVSVVGEAARVEYMVGRGGVPMGTAVASVVWARAVEALGLALFMIVAPSFLKLPPILHSLQLGGGIVLASVLASALSGRWSGLNRRLPERVRAIFSTLTQIEPARQLLLPTLLGLFNWGAQWATYHLTLLALHVPTTLASSFTALIVTNLGGVFRVSPGNVGMTQAAMALGLLPFGVQPHEAVAAGLALQGIQILPVLALGLATAGRRGLAAATARPAHSRAL